MKTNKFLTAVSAVALLGATSFALAQGSGGGAGGSAGGGAAGSSSGAGTSSGAGGAGGAAPSAPGGAQSSPSAPGAASGGSQAQGTGGMSGEKNAPAQAQGQTKEIGKDSQKSNQAQDQKAPAGNDKSAKDGNSKSGSTVGSAPASGGGSLTTEQRTVVREKVLTSSAPRVTNVNFSINVGTVVPTSVRVVTVPQTIIDIRPEWRGFRYFVVKDEIIIVEPNSLKIVAVWPV